MKNLLSKFTVIIASASMLTLAGTAFAQDGKDPETLSDGNLFANPGFNGADCYKGWIPVVQKDKSVICGGGAGGVWLDHNNTIGDPAVYQTLTGLDTTKEYIVIASWRPGKTAKKFTGQEPQPIFGIKLSKKDLKFYSPDAKDGQSTIIRRKFTPESEKMHFEFRGEAGPLDGDVFLEWVSLRQVATQDKFDKEAIVDLIPAGNYTYDQFANGVVTIKGNVSIKPNGDGIEKNDAGEKFTWNLKNIDGLACFDTVCYEVTGPDSNGILQLSGDKNFTFTPKN